MPMRELVDPGQAALEKGYPALVSVIVVHAGTRAIEVVASAKCAAVISLPVVFDVSAAPRKSAVDPIGAIVPWGSLSL